MSAVSGVSAAVPSQLLSGAQTLRGNADALRSGSEALTRAGRSAACGPAPQAAFDALIALWAPALGALGDATAELAGLVVSTASEFTRADGG